MEYFHRPSPPTLRPGSKIPLDAGASCPNRDGTLSRAGCTFCNAIGSGSGLGLAGMNLPAQWEHWREHFRRSNRASLFLAYLQSFSNTYGPASRLAAMLQIFRTLPDLAGVSVGTRPDCLDPEKMAILGTAPWKEKWRAASGPLRQRHPAPHQPGARRGGLGPGH